MQSTVRAKAKEADKVWDERYIQRKMKDNPPSSTLRARRASFIPVVYLICTARKGTTCRVPSRYSWRNCSIKRRTAQKRGFVTEGKIIKRNLRVAKYKISFENPATKSHQCSWVSVLIDTESYLFCTVRDMERSP